MGVQARIVLYAAHPEAASNAAATAFAEIARLDAIMSDYRPDSELMRLCAAPAGEAVIVSDDLFHVLRASQEISRASDGAFDVTVGPLSRLWRESRQNNCMPEQSAIDAALALVDWRKMTLNDAARTVQLNERGMSLDLGGIAKGYAADRARGRLRDAGYPCCLVALAGDIALGIPPPESKGWMIEAPASAAGQLSLANCSVSTSGDAEQFIEVNGERISHIIDPRRGLRAAQPRLVTVTAPDGATADALASALLVQPELRDRLAAAFPGVTIMISE